MKDYIDLINEEIKKQQVVKKYMAEDLKMSYRTLARFLSERKSVNSNYLIKILDYLGLEIRAVNNE